MVKIKNFSEGIEKDIDALGERIEVQRTETRPEDNISEHEVVKRSIQSFATDVVEEMPVASPSAPQDGGGMPSYLSDAYDDASVQAKHEVERLVNLTFSEGIEHGVREAKKAPPFVEDAFHDALVDRLLPELKKRGILQ